MWPAVTASLWPMSASASGRRQAVLIRNCSRSTGWRLPPACCAAAIWNIQQIITYVGYENTSYFYRLFHERYGLSPREYRQVRAVRSRTTA